MTLALQLDALALSSGDLFLAVAFVLLIAGVVGSILPSIPGAPLSLAGVLLYWWTTGEPGTFLLVALVFVALLTLAVDWLGGIVAARASGVDDWVSVLAGLVGLVLLFVLGPIGVIVGVAGTVFVVTYYQEEDTHLSARRAAYATAGVLASAVVQGILTASILVTVVFVHLL